MKLKQFLLLLVSVILSLNLYSQGVIISNTAGQTPDGSAMLEIQSTKKGLLIPRMTTVQRKLIASPVSGLLVYDITEGSFYLYGQSKWNDLSTAAGIWSTNSSDVYLTNSTNNVGIGTSTPNSKFVIQADASKAASDPIFEIKDVTGKPIMIVTSEGVRVYVKGMSKGVSGGFAVGQYGTVKNKTAGDMFFTVTPDSTRVYTLPKTGTSGGFAVGQYGTVKGGAQRTTFYTAPDSTRVYTTPSAKGVSGGFAVGQYGTVKGGTDNYMFMVPDNYFIGHNAGEHTTPGAGDIGKYNLFFGFESGITNTLGYQNTFVGHNTGHQNTDGYRNVFLGNDAGYNNASGYSNVFVGTKAGNSNTLGIRNVFLGNYAGYSNVGSVSGDFHYGSGNVFLGDSAGFSNTSAVDNVFVGTNSGNHTTTGYRNVFIGHYTGYRNTTGLYNFYGGFKAGLNNNGMNNVFIGNQAGYNATNSWNNVFLGNASGNKNTTGGDNVYVGNASGNNNTDGEKNVYIGDRSGLSATTGSNNVFVGQYAGNYAEGSRNVCLGMEAGKGTAASDGNDNVFLGYHAGFSNLGGDNNVFAGRYAGSANTSGTNNVFLGHASGMNNKVGEGNTYVGWNTGTNNLGNNNVFIGNGTGPSSSRTISGNIQIGYYAGSQETNNNRLYIENSNTTAPLIYGEFDNNVLGFNANVGIGTQTPGSHRLYVTSSETGTDGVSSYVENTAAAGIAGHFINTSSSSSDCALLVTNKGTGNIMNLDSYFSGGWKRQFVFTGDGKLGIGTSSPATSLHVNHPTGQTNGLSISNANDADRWHFYVYTTNDLYLYFNNNARGHFDDVSGTYASLSDRNLKKDIVKTGNVLSKINKLEVVNYSFIGQKTNTRYTGFIAQDVNEIFPNLVSHTKANKFDKNKELYMLNYSGFGVIAIKAIQEQQLQINSQQKIIEQLQKKNIELQNSFNILKSEIEEIKNKIK